MQQSGGECYSSDRRLGGGGGCWYRTNFRIGQSSNNSKHNGNISSLSQSPLLDPHSPEKIPLLYSSPNTLHAHRHMHELGWLALLSFSTSFSFPSFPFFYIYKCCVCHIIMNVMGLVGRAVGRLLYDCFSPLLLSLFFPFSRRAV